jgi:predicted dehydrogenase
VVERSVNLALLGAGAWGRNLLRTLATARDGHLRVCCDTNGTSCRDSLEGYRSLEFREDPETVMNDPDIDAVVIATPAVTHYDLAVRAIRAGKDVFVEKPMTLTLEQATHLVEFAENEGRILMVGHLLEYHPAVQVMKDLLSSGELGVPYYIYSQRVNLGKIRADENALWSFAPHDISIILYLFDEEPIQVAAAGAAYIREGIEDVTFLCMKFADGKMAQIHVSWLDPHKIRRTTLVGSKKMVVFDDMQASEKIKIYDKGVELNGHTVGYADSLTLRFGEVTIPAIKMREPLRLECDHFLECVLNRTTPRSDGRDGLRVVKVLDAAQRSLESGGSPVDLS